MLGLPIYLRAGVYYLHYRHNGRQIKKSLRTPYKREAIARALQLLSSGGESVVNKLKITIGDFVAETDPNDPQDHKTLAELLASPAGQNLLNAEAERLRGSGKAPAAPAYKPAVSTGGPKLSEVLDQFLAVRNLVESSVKSYRERFAIFTAHGPKDMPVTDFTRDHLLNFRDKMLMRLQNSPKTKRGEVYKVSTVGAVMILVQSLLNFSVERGYIDKNPCVGVQNPNTKKEKRANAYKVPTTSEAHALLKFKPVGLQDRRYYFVMLLSALTGARVGEITAIKKNGFKLDANGRHYFEVDDAKSPAGVRAVPFPGELWELGLTEIGERCNSGIFFDYKKTPGKGYGNAVTKRNGRHRAEIGLKRHGVVFHGFRKYLNTRLYEMGITEEIREQLLGHEGEGENSKTYTQYTIEHLAKVVEPAQKTLLAEFLALQN